MTYEVRIVNGDENVGQPVEFNTAQSAFAESKALLAMHKGETSIEIWQDGNLLCEVFTAEDAEQNRMSGI